MKRQMTVLSLAVSMCLVLTACGQYDSSTPEYTGVSSGRDSYFAPAAGSSSFGTSDTADSDSSYVDGQIANVANDVSQMQDAQEEYGDALNEAMEDVGNFEDETDTEAEGNGSDNGSSDNGETGSEDETESETGTDDTGGSSGGSSGSGGSSSGSSGSSTENSEDESETNTEPDSEGMTEETITTDSISETNSDTEETDGSTETNDGTEETVENESESESESEGISMAQMLFPETVEDETEDPSFREDAGNESETEDDDSAELFESNNDLTAEGIEAETVQSSDIESMTEETEDNENRFSISLLWSRSKEDETEAETEADALGGIAANESEASDNLIAEVLDETMEGMESVLADGEAVNSSDTEETENAENTVLELLTDDGIITAEDLFSENLSDDAESAAEDNAEDALAMETDAYESGDDVLYSLQQYLTQELDVMADSLWGSDDMPAAESAESMESTLLEEGSAGDAIADAEEPAESFGEDVSDMQDVLTGDIQQSDDLSTDISDDLTKYVEILSLSDEFTPYLDDFQSQLEQMQQDIGLDTDLSSGLDTSSADSLLNSLDSLDISSTGSLDLSSDMESYLKTFQSEIGSSLDTSLDISGLDTDSMFNMFVISSIVDEIQSYSMDTSLSNAIDSSSFDALFSGFSSSLLSN